MWLVILVLGLVGAGIYTDNSGFYVAAGVAGAIMVLVTIGAALTARSFAKKIDQEFKSFDERFKGFR